MSNRIAILAVMGAVLFLRPLTPAHPSVSAFRTPNDGVVPEAALDSKGVLHITYGAGSEGYYVQSRDRGKTFSVPIQLNRRAGTVTVGAERGPKLALGREGVIHAVWLG
ncbi:MAG: hypothetical protein HY318_06605, partial [Armatimonadetes bacterium]|nr:hypothetical protein [Armatimonadota bacterium]